SHWFDCLAASPDAATCAMGDYGSTTQCLAQYDALEACIRGGGTAVGAKGPDSAPASAGTRR
ncbi:MAG: hypothetical protein INH37_23330, partial [Myxococcaceae bacterium]|nr:hypothetical protein [Myxococcaceae bacterium]